MVLPLAWVEAVAEVMCKRGILARDESIAPGASSDAAPIHGSYADRGEILDEPDAGATPEHTKSPTR